MLFLDYFHGFVYTEYNSARTVVLKTRRLDLDCINPSDLATANKLAEYLEVSLDYLTGNTDVLLDTLTLNRVLEVQQLPEDIKDKLFYFIDMTIRDYKAKKAYSS